MTLYSRVNLSTFVGGQPGDLPASLVGLADQSLADLSAAIKPVPREFAGSGYWPVVEEDVTAPTLDRPGRRYLVPRPPAPQPFVPSSITMRQAKLMLHRAGLLADIETKIANMPGDAARRLGSSGRQDPCWSGTTHWWPSWVSQTIKSTACSSGRRPSSRLV